MSYCAVCGKARVAGGAFCTGCGAPQPLANAASPPAGAAPSSPAAYAPVSAPAALPPPAPRGGSGLRTFIIVAVVMLLTVVGLGIAGVIYAVRAAKHKAGAVCHNPVKPHPHLRPGNFNMSLGAGIGYSMPKVVANVINTVLGWFGAKPIKSSGTIIAIPKRKTLIDHRDEIPTGCAG